MNPPVAELSGVHRTYQVHGKALPVLRGIDLCIHPGDRIVLFGPSGCGKTTLLHLLGLLDLPDEGEQFMGGTSLRNLSEAQRSRHRAEHIGLVFQTFHLLPHHSVRQNIRLRVRYLPCSPISSSHENEILRQVGLESHAERPARLLSGGEQQRVCIARALLHRPALFLADEPTGNLDEEHSLQIQQLFMEVAKHAPVVVATHDASWLDFATRVCRFHEGRLIEERS